MPAVFGEGGIVPLLAGAKRVLPWGVVTGNGRAVGTRFVIPAIGGAKRARVGEERGDDVYAPFAESLLAVSVRWEVAPDVSSAFGMELGSA